MMKRLSAVPVITLGGGRCETFWGLAGLGAARLIDVPFEFNAKLCISFDTGCLTSSIIARRRQKIKQIRFTEFALNLHYFFISFFCNTVRQIILPQ